MALTLDVAQAALTQAQADLAVAQGAQTHAVSSSTGGRSLTRGNVKELLEVVQYWQGQVDRLERNQKYVGIRVRGGTPV
jgi:hypothetical protein